MNLLGAALVALYTIFLAWHPQRRRKLTHAEIDHYLSIIEKSVIGTNRPKEDVRFHGSFRRDNGHATDISRRPNLMWWTAPAPGDESP